MTEKQFENSLSGILFRKRTLNLIFVIFLCILRHIYCKPINETLRESSVIPHMDLSLRVRFWKTNRLLSHEQAGLCAVRTGHCAETYERPV